MDIYSSLYFPKDRIKALLLLLVVALVYLPFLNNPLIFDDFVLVGGGGVSYYADALFNFDFRWFPYSSLGVTWVFFGEEPMVFRIQNLLLHGINVLMLLLLLRLWISLFIAEPNRRRMMDWGAWLGALIFACHPLAVYGVGYLVQRSILMATLFTFVMHLSYLRGLIDGDKRYAVLAVAAYFLAVFSKEHSLLIPAILLPVTWVLRHKMRLSGRALLFTWLGFAVIACIVLLRAKGLLGQAYEKDAASLLEQDGLLKGMPMVHLLSVLTQAGLFFKYLLLMLLPNPAWMSIDMRETFIMDWRDWQSWTGIFAYLVYGLGGLWCLLRGGRVALFGLALLYPWSLYPVEFSSVRVQEIFVLYRAYLWLPGLLLLIPVICGSLSERKILLGAVLSIVLLVPLAWNRLWTFADTFRLWDDAVQLLHGEDRLGSHRTYFNRARAAAAKKDWNEAIAGYRKSLSINSNHTEVNVALGRVLIDTKQYKEAIVEFDKAILKEPYNGEAYYVKAFALKNLHDNDGAIQALKKSCDLNWQQACAIISTMPKMPQMRIDKS